MRISLQPLNRLETLTWEVTLLMEELCEEVSHLKRLKPIQVKGQVRKTSTNLYNVTAEQSTQAVLICSRCLQEFAMPLTTQWEVQFTEEVGMVQEVNGQEILRLEGEQIDVTPLVREALLLQIPYAPICQEDCKGFCPNCGINRNHTECKCEREVIDSRWIKLQELSEEG